MKFNKTDFSWQMFMAKLQIPWCILFTSNAVSFFYNMIKYIVHWTALSKAEHGLDQEPLLQREIILYANLQEMYYDIIKLNCIITIMAFTDNHVYVIYDIWLNDILKFKNKLHHAILLSWNLIAHNLFVILETWNLVYM